MARLSVKINEDAYDRVLNSEGVMKRLDALGEQAVSFANSVGTAVYAYKPAQEGRRRAHVIVYTPSRHAIYSNAKHDTLVKTLANLRSR